MRLVVMFGRLRWNKPILITLSPASWRIPVCVTRPSSSCHPGHIAMFRRVPGMCNTGTVWDLLLFTEVPLLFHTPESQKSIDFRAATFLGQNTSAKVSKSRLFGQYEEKCVTFYFLYYMLKRALIVTSYIISFESFKIVMNQTIKYSFF